MAGPRAARERKEPQTDIVVRWQAGWWGEGSAPQPCVGTGCRWVVGMQSSIFLQLKFFLFPHLFMYPLPQTFEEGLHN